MVRLQSFRARHCSFHGIVPQSFFFRFVQPWIIGWTALRKICLPQYFGGQLRS
jgi:hypothetical protein